MQSIFKIRASAANKILADAKGLSGKEAYEECIASIAIKKEEARGCSEKAVKTKEKLIREITELEYTKLPMLEASKHLTFNISVGAMTYVKQWVKELYFDRTKPKVYSKYFDKGNACENGSIDLLVPYLGWPFDTMKNTEYKENEYFTGTPDIVLASCIPDVKNPYTWETFPVFDTQIENEDYNVQLDVYEELFQKPEGLLCYTLMNAPENLIDQAYWKGHRDAGLAIDAPVDEDLLDFYRREMTYDDLPTHKRVKTFPHKHRDNIISKLQNRVLECREYHKYLLTINK